MDKRKRSIIDDILSFFSRFEQIISLLLVVIVALIISISLIRIIQSFYEVFVSDLFRPANISFNDYQQIFGKIMTLLISIEFMASILKVFKTHEIRDLVKDVVLITGLAIARKLIVYDYDSHDPLTTIVLGGLLISIGIFYYLIKDSNKVNAKQ